MNIKQKIQIHIGCNNNQYTTEVLGEILHCKEKEFLHKLIRDKLDEDKYEIQFFYNTEKI